MIGYPDIASFMKAINRSGMSDSSKGLWQKMIVCLASDGTFTDSGIAKSMLDSIASVLPVALTVAGAILVVTLGWRLFRNFTRG